MWCSKNQNSYIKAIKSLDKKSLLSIFLQILKLMIENKKNWFFLSWCWKLCDEVDDVKLIDFKISTDSSIFKRIFIKNQVRLSTSISEVMWMFFIKVAVFKNEIHKILIKLGSKSTIRKSLIIIADRFSV